MKKGRSRAKGSNYERNIAEKFTNAYYPNGDGEFRRIPLSGGWDKRLMPGDLVPFKFTKDGAVIDDSFAFTVECKNWYDVPPFFVGLYAEESSMFAWIKQVADDAKYVNKNPLVVFKLYRSNDVCIIPRFVFNKLEELFGCLNKKKYYVLCKSLSDGADIGSWFILLSDFLTWIDWDIYKLKGNVSYIRSIVAR